VFDERLQQDRRRPADGVAEASTTGILAMWPRTTAMSRA
jgi:hypothetical protein